MKNFVLVLIALLVPGLMQASEFPVADVVVIEKGERQLHLMQGGKAFRTYKIALGIRPVGDKKREGDFKTPEGRYTLDRRNPDSEFFLSIHVSYPNTGDRQEAANLGVSPGGAIMIHGQPNVPTRSEGLLPDAGLDQWLHRRVQF